MAKTRHEELIESVLESKEGREGFLEQTFAMALGQAVRAYREQQVRVTQTQLGKSANIGQSEISQIESGELPRGPSPATLTRLAQSLNAPIQLTFNVDGTVRAVVGSIPQKTSVISGMLRQRIPTGSSSSSSSSS